MVNISGIEYLIYLLANLTLLIFLFFFFASSLTRYLSNKSKSAFYLISVYFFYLLVYTLQLIISIYNFLDLRDIFYDFIKYQFTIFVVAAAMCLLLFYHEFEPLSKKIIKIALILGSILIGWMIITFNVLSPLGLTFTIYLSFLLLTIYSGIIYLYTGSKFLKVSLKAGSNQGLYFGIANICFFLYEFTKIIFVFSEIVIINLISILFIFIAFLLYFLSIYMPKYRSS